MDAIQSLTRAIEVFVDFFRSINCLFFQIQWLQNNCEGTDRTTFGIVGALLGISLLYVLFCEFGQDCSDPAYTRNAFGLILVLSIVGYFVYRRWFTSQSSSRFTPVVAKLGDTPSNKYERNNKRAGEMENLIPRKTVAPIAIV